MTEDAEIFMLLTARHWGTTAHNEVSEHNSGRNNEGQCDVA